MNIKDLVAKLKQLEGLTPNERAELINLLNTKKKYGLIWEDKPEDVEEQLRTKLPVLREVVEKRILATKTASETATPKAIKTNLFTEVENQSSDNGLLSEAEAPNHILIEGDNLHALTALTFTHENKIDVIYIDPPYNTGNKDFKYNDAFVDKEDNYRHSKWLSFMHKRLEIAKRLMSDKGVIFISIDDNEQSQLKMLCDEIFVNNFIVSLPRITKASGKTTNKIALNHDFVLVYCKDKNLAVIEGLDHNDKGFKYSDVHVEKRGLYKLNQTLDYDSLQYSASLDYEIEIEGLKLYPGSSLDKYLERKSGKYNRADWAWRWSKDLFEFGLKNDFIVLKHSKKGSRIYTKTYLNAIIEEDDDGEYFVEYMERKKPLTSLQFIDKLFSNDNGKKDLNKVLKQSIFDYPKPISLISTFLKTNPNKSLTILDFFAGSGTTLHATMQLNAEDGGNRQCILVTNNENNICEEVTYERNKRVIQGYTNVKGVQVEGLTNNNMRYYRSEYVGREHTHKNKKELVLTATELLCIKEDIYTELAELNGEKLNNKVVRCFSDNGKYMMLIYDEEAIETLLPLISTINSHQKIKIYIFAPGQYPFIEEFEDVLDKVELCALPDAIYKAYANVLPKKKAKPIVVESDEESTESETSESEEPNLFTI